MKATTELIKHFCNQQEDKSLVGRKCRVTQKYIQDAINKGCKAHADLIEGELTIVFTQVNWKGDLAVRVQNDKIKNMHPGCGDFLNSFIMSMDEIELI